jgi:hypothetical protein
MIIKGGRPRAPASAPIFDVVPVLVTLLSVPGATLAAPPPSVMGRA